MVNFIKFRDAIIFHRVMDLYSWTGRTFLISLQGKLNLAYETYHTCILFFWKIRTYANVFYFSVRVCSSLDDADEDGDGGVSAATRRWRRGAGDDATPTTGVSDEWMNALQRWHDTMSPSRASCPGSVRYGGIRTLYILSSDWVRTIYIAEIGRMRNRLRLASRFTTN